MWRCGRADQQRAALTSDGLGLDLLRAATVTWRTRRSARTAGRGDSDGGRSAPGRRRRRRERATERAGGGADTSKQISQLGELSASIDDFVELIKRISSQTNLLP